jgi:hypothetical protein
MDDGDFALVRQIVFAPGGIVCQDRDLISPPRTQLPRSLQHIDSSRLSVVSYAFLSLNFSQFQNGFVAAGSFPLN